jgi:hypothetical protein
MGALGCFLKFITIFVLYFSIAVNYLNKSYFFEKSLCVTLMYMKMEGCHIVSYVPPMYGTKMWAPRLNSKKARLISKTLEKFEG